ncbi:hypothetical protein [Microterricola pindariensis]|uniref:Uncharacterized protein n=1 Tax=Microterricola pindariensis TaxID=478010 RepID=A0ABX5AY01_9MICO|nr:hypothetical protein [Microterricola pindariensis]PPL19803.1 hypothetical protein GY24_04080 [Microterricola pindariensis]
MMPPLISEAEFTGSRAKEIAAEYFLALVAQVEPLIDRINGFNVQVDSALESDDQDSRTDAVSHQARALLSVAADNVNTLAAVAVKAVILPAFAGYTLLRNVIECAGVALWLIGPASSDQRVLRALQLSRESLGDQRRLEATKAGGKYAGLAPTDSVLRKLEIERDMRPSNTGARLMPPSITERLEEAEAYVTRHADHQEALVVFWQRASGLAHGRRHAVWNVSDARIRRADHVGFQAVIAADIVALTAHFEAAVNYLEDGVRMLEQRGSR